MHESVGAIAVDAFHRCSRLHYALAAEATIDILSVTARNRELSRRPAGG